MSESEGKAVSTPRSDSQVSISRSKNGSIRKVARKSANSSATSYRSLPSKMNESVSSSISTISVDSTTHSLEKRPKGSSDVTIEPEPPKAQLFSISRQDTSTVGHQQDTSTQKLIQETWADLLNREKQEKRNLSRPDLTVTPISSINSTLLRQDLTNMSTPSRTPSILRSSTTSIGSSKSVTFTDTVNVKEYGINIIICDFFAILILLQYDYYMWSFNYKSGEKISLKTSAHVSRFCVVRTIRPLIFG